MKRSEMAEIIRDRIRAISGNNKFSMVDSYQLLNTIEEAGMLPPDAVNPKLEKEYKGLLDFIDSNSYPNCVDYEKGYYVNEWEPEDEL